MKNIIMNVVIILLVAANVFTGTLIYSSCKPRCLSDNCNRIRVSGSRYCHKHDGTEDLVTMDETFTVKIEREICLEVKTRNSN